MAAWEQDRFGIIQLIKRILEINSEKIISCQFD